MTEAADEPMSYEDAEHPLVNHMGKADDELLALARKAERWTDPSILVSAQAIIALIERHNAEVERLTRERDEARESAHYAGGVADLAMKHRDIAESALAAAQRVLDLRGLSDANDLIAEKDAALAAERKRVGELEADKANLIAMLQERTATVKSLEARAALAGKEPARTELRKIADELEKQQVTQHQRGK